MMTRTFGRQYALLLLMFLLPFLGFAQDKINGHVYTSDKLPAAGVSVLIKGTSAGTYTKDDGTFSITVKTGETIIVSGVGFEPVEYIVKPGIEPSITITQNSKNMDEVVVTALGVKKEIKKIGYAVQEVKGEDLVKARDQNPISGLTGKVAGLSVGPSAELLRAPTVILRGNTLSLYVVDGIPISSDTWNISPDDIESYSVLKGPTAAALYGSRAQYGAILITTKKGSKKKGWTVEVNSTNSMDKGFIAFPRVQDEYGGGENQLYAFGDGKGGGLNDNDYDVWGPKFRGQLLPQYDGAYDPNQTYTTTYGGGKVYTGHIAPTPYVARGKNNLGRFLRPGFQTTNNVSMSTSGDNYTMRFSLSHSYQQSIIPNMELNITNFNISGSYNPTKNLRIEANFNYNRQYTPNFPDVDYGPNSLLYNVGVWTGADWDVDAPDIKAIWKPGQVGIQSVFAEYQRYHNPWFMVKEWLRGHYKSDMYGYALANYKIDNHLSAQLRTQITTYNLLRTERMPYSAHPYGREQNQGDYREDRRDLFENNTDLQLNYNYSAAHNFLTFGGFLGASARNFSYNSNFTTTDYLSVPGVYSFSNSLNAVQANSFASDMRVLSAYGSLDLGISRYATIGVTARVDKSSALPTGHNSYFYPSISLASAVSDYIRLPEVISFLKIRASYAQIHGDATDANIGVAPFSTITQLGANPSGTSLQDYPLDYGNNYQSPYGGPNYSLIQVYSTGKPYNNQPAATYSNFIVDPNIKTFKRVNFEQGFDIKFLKNRLGLSATAFQYQDGPLILNNTISNSTGFGTYYLNALKTRKTGYEVSISGTPMHTKNFNWDITINWSTFKDVYTELPPGQSIYNTFFEKGDRVDKFYGTAFVRTPDHQIVYDDKGYPLANPVNQYLGNLNADYQWAVINKFSYKQLSLGFQFDGSVGGVTTDYMHLKTMRGGRNALTAEGAFGVARDLDDQHAGDPDYAGTYVGKGAVVSNGVAINYDSKTGAVLNQKDLAYGSNTSTKQIQPFVSAYYNTDESNLMSKTFAKLREVTIGYSLPAKMLAGSFVKNVTFSLVGRNLIYFYKKSEFKDVDLDQYNYALGGTGLQSPTTRRFGFNLNVVF